MKTIPFLSLEQQHKAIRTEVLSALTSVYDKNWFILGNELENFETAFARFSNAAFCVGTGNGLDALFISLKAHGIGDGHEVIVPAHTFLATWIAVLKTGARVIPVEPDPKTFNIDTTALDSFVTEKTRAIIPVHLYGQPCDMTMLEKFVQRHKILMIEDNAQAQGATWNGRVTGSFGNSSATSFYPIKNLGALGDGGAIVTKHEEVAQYARRFRNYGFEAKNIANQDGMNSRLDEMQAAVLNVKLKYIANWNAERIKLAHQYQDQLQNVGDIQLPQKSSEALHVYHLFVICTSRRNDLRNFLTSRNIETAVHYPVPPHLQKGFQSLGYKKGDYPIAEDIADTAISLPLWIGMESDQIEYVCETIKQFF